MIAVIVAGCTGGCVDSFSGSNVQLDLDPFTVVQQRIADPMPMALNEIPTASHFVIRAIREAANPADTVITDVARFELHRIVDLTSPCFIDVGEHVPYPGIHVTAYSARVAAETGIPDVANPPANATEVQKIRAATAVQRNRNIQALGNDVPGPMGTVALGVRAVVSASTSSYPPVGADCNTTTQIPPAMCMEDAANAVRLRLCQQAWAADPMLWEGTDRVLTEPLNGITYGMVRGINPVNLGPVGGAQFFVEDKLEGVDRYAIFSRADSDPGMGAAVVAGNPSRPTRGVVHVLMVGAPAPGGGPGPQVTNLAIFQDLSDDKVHF